MAYSYHGHILASEAHVLGNLWPFAFSVSLWSYPVMKEEICSVHVEYTVLHSPMALYGEGPFSQLSKIQPQNKQSNALWHNPVQ